MAVSRRYGSGIGDMGRTQGLASIVALCVESQWKFKRSYFLKLLIAVQPPWLCMRLDLRFPQIPQYPSTT